MVIAFVILYKKSPTNFLDIIKEVEYNDEVLLQQCI